MSGGPERHDFFDLDSFKKGTTAVQQETRGVSQREERETKTEDRTEFQFWRLSHTGLRRAVTVARPFRANGAWNRGEQGNSRRRICVDVGEVGVVRGVCREEMGEGHGGQLLLFILYLPLSGV